MKSIAHQGLSVDIYAHENKPNLGSIIMIPGGSGKKYSDKSGKIFTGYDDLAERFSKAGFNVILFDAKGQVIRGKGFSCPNAVNDLSNIVNFTSSSFKTNNIGIWGRCGGAIIAAKYVITYHSIIKSLAFWGCPTNISRYYKKDVLEDAIKRLEDKGVAVDKSSIHEIWDFEDMANELKIPFLFAVGTNDSYFQEEKTNDVLKSLPKSILYNFIQLSGFGHEVDRCHPFFDYYCGLFINWFSSTLTGNN